MPSTPQVTPFVTGSLLTASPEQRSYPGGMYPGGSYPGGGVAAGTPPSIVKPPTQTGHVGEADGLQIEPAGQSSYGASGLPAGLSINASTGAISGTLTTVESPTVTIRAFNAEGSEASTTFTWTVEAAPAPTVSKPPDQTTEKGVAVSLFIEATNTTEYKATGLPAGLSINASTGQITGAPTTIGAAKTVTIKVKGPTAPEAETTFQWTIVAAVTPSVIVGGSQKPPLALHAELVYPDGTTTRWDSDAKEAANQPVGITFRTQRYTGFADAQLTLNRRIDQDYPDLRLLDGLNLIGYDGSVAYEGWLGSMPRSLQTGPQISLQAGGWMTHAKDEPFVEVYVDRDLSKWVAPAMGFVAGVLGENFSYGSNGQLLDEAGNPAVELNIQGSWASPFRPVAEAWWLPQPGIKLGAIYYFFTEGNPKTMSEGDANWNIHVWLASDDKRTELDITPNLWPGAKAGYLENTGTRTAAAIQLYYGSTPGGSEGASYFAHFTKLAVYGDHGLVGHKEAGDPAGFTVSQMIANIAQRFAPKLDTSGIQETTFVVPHASFLSETLPYDAFQTLNAFHRWELAVYEGRKLLYYPIDLNDWDWQVRTTDKGVTVNLQGDDSEHLCNGVTVRYTDLATGYETRLSPDDFPELKDESPDNPYNIAGRKGYQTMTISVPTTREGAIQMGRTFLAEFNQPASPGTITVAGHIQDRAGHWQQGWKVRAGDRLVIADQPNDRVRVVGETSWDHDSKQLTISVDGSLKRLDAVLARLGVAIEASNFRLP